MEQKLVKQLFEAIAEKLMKREDDSSFFLKFDFNSFSKKIHRKDFLRAIDVLDIRINENDVLLISRVLDPDNDGYYDLTSLMQEISKNEKNPRSQQPFNSAYDRMEPLGEITEKALRSILDDLHTFCKKSNKFLIFLWVYYNKFR